MSNFGKIFKNIIVFLALLPIYFYRLVIRPLLPQSCKFYPTCSQYAIISIKRFGAFMGWWMASKRILRCQPFSKGSGYDPVPYYLKGGAKWIV